MKRTLLLALLFPCACAISYAQGNPEICDNGIDDDNDGYIDCYDLLDCPCESQHDCFLPEVRKNFELERYWESPVPLSGTSSPIVGNLDPWVDSISEIVQQCFGEGGRHGFYIFKGNGSNWNQPDFLDLGQNLVTYSMSPAMADLDGNGVPELFTVCADKKIRIYNQYTVGANPPMSLWITATDTCESSAYRAYAADFNGDGLSEIYAGNEVYGLDLSNPGAPALRLLAKGNGPAGYADPRFFSSIAADVLSSADCNGDPDCNGLEICAGYGIYSVDIDPNDGDGMQVKLQRNLRTMSGLNFSDGFTGVADLNLDGTPEIIVTGRINQELCLYAWNKTGFNKVFKLNLPPFYDVGHPGGFSVGNVFDDHTKGFAADWPEILLRYGDRFFCANLQAPASFWWINTTLLNDDQSGKGVPSNYDFDNDGLSEFIIGDEDSLYIGYGGPAPFPAGVGTTRAISSIKTGNVTGDDIPVVVDLDGDGNPEIIAHDFNPPPFTYYGLLVVLRAKNPDYSKFLPARSVWNQYAYHVVNIEDDLRVPKQQMEGWREMPVPGSGKRPLNTFMAQHPAYFHNDADPYFPSADLSVTVKEVICQLPTFKVRVEICNKGDRPSADTTKLRFYRGGDPFSNGNANSIGTFTVSTQPIPPDSCIEFTALLQTAFGNVYAVLNDWGKYNTPLPGGDTAFYRQECDLQNNIAIFKMDLSHGIPLDAGPDRTMCAGTTETLTASSGFNSYVWQNGSTNASIQVGLPGLYWVEAKDLCFNIKRDTILLIPGESYDTLRSSLCAGEVFTYNGHDIPAGSQMSFTYTNAAGCDSVYTVEITALPTSQGAETRQLCTGDSTLVFGQYVQQAGQYVKHFTGVNGCDSTFTIVVDLLPPPVPGTETRKICPGDSTLIFGQYVHQAGPFTQHFSSINGCDSTYTVVVELFPAPMPGAETRQICPGDSVLVFGNYVYQAGQYVQHFSNANGCDSTYTITVGFLPGPVPSSETLKICPGDSVLVFGNYVQQAGQYVQHFSSANGCDSIHTVVVQMYPAPAPGSEMHKICPGDSVLVFGNYVHQAGQYVQHFSNANGCDSTHTVTVQLYPAPAPGSEMHKICPGDSVLVFGNYVHQAGQYVQHFSNANGCDSIHTVTVQLFPAPAPGSETLKICPGDSVLVFGNFVHQAGQYVQHFSNVNGCDSTHTVTVQVFPTPAPGSEMLKICPGDSVLVFGNYVHQAGQYVQHFSNVNACDSTYTVTVQLHPVPAPGSETLKICPGDSVLVFGNYVHQAGQYVQHFSNANGCDSTYTVTVQLHPAPTPGGETLKICPGDSVLVFGNYVQQAGQYLKNYFNANGCDSTYTVTVQLFPAPTPGIGTLKICPGDSVLVFGQYVHQVGQYMQHFLNANGCDSLHTIEVLENDLIELSDSLSLCPGDSLWVAGQWVTQPGSLQQTLSGQAGCDTLKTYWVAAIAFPASEFQVLQPTDAVQGGRLEIFKQTGFLYSLNGGNFSDQSIYPGLPPGHYVLQEKNASCLRDTFFDILAYEKPDSGKVYAPNILRPENSGENGHFTLYAAPGTLQEVIWMRIYDRWGSLVFENQHFSASVPESGWDGRIKGKIAAPGVYVWQAMVKTADAEVLKAGNLTIIR